MDTKSFSLQWSKQRGRDFSLSRNEPQWELVLVKVKFEAIKVFRQQILKKIIIRINKYAFLRRTKENFPQRWKWQRLKYSLLKSTKINLGKVVGHYNVTWYRYVTDFFRTLLLFSFWKNSRKLFGYTSSAGASTQKYKYVSSLENKF